MLWRQYHQADPAPSRAQAPLHEPMDRLRRNRKTFSPYGAGLLLGLGFYKHVDPPDPGLA